MQEAVEYAVEQMKKEGFLLDVKATKRAFAYLVDYIHQELHKGNDVRISGLGTFVAQIRPEKEFYSHLSKKMEVMKKKIIPVLKFTDNFKRKVDEGEQYFS